MSYGNSPTMTMSPMMMGMTNAYPRQQQQQQQQHPGQARQAKVMLNAKPGSNSMSTAYPSSGNSTRTFWFVPPVATTNLASGSYNQSAMQQYPNASCSWNWVWILIGVIILILLIVWIVKAVSHHHKEKKMMKGEYGDKDNYATRTFDSIKDALAL